MTRNGKIGVGIVGYEAGRSWAAVAHAPALRGLPDFAITAVATTREATARAAAADLRIEHAFSSAADLAACDEVDLVAVTVKVPQHLDLVRTAIAAGKHVYCEWPLGNGLAEAEEMASMVGPSELRAVVGLQARYAPVIGYLRDIVASGELGEVLSSNIHGTGGQWGDWVDPPNAYLLDVRNGATLLSIPFGHSVDAMCFCLGEFRRLSATTALRVPDVRLKGSNQIIGKTAPDQIGVTGILESGALAVVHYRGGTSRGANFVWEINGTKGDLRIEAASGHAQMAELTLSGGFGSDRKLAPMSVPPQYRWVPQSISGVATNVAQLYQCLANDLRNGTRTATCFEAAVTRHRLLAAIERAAATGQAVDL